MTYHTILLQREQSPFHHIQHTNTHEPSFLFLKKNFLLLLLFLLLYSIVLVLPYINMHPPRVYTCSPSWTFLSYHPSHFLPHLPSIPWSKSGDILLVSWFFFFFLSGLLGMNLGRNCCTVWQATFLPSCESQSSGWVTRFAFPADLCPKKHG